MKALVAFASLLTLGLAPAGLAPDHGQCTAAEHLTLGLEGARAALGAAEALARARGVGAAIAVVDEGGHLLAHGRLDDTFPAAANVSIGKARTAAMFRRPTSFFEDAVNGGRVAMTALADFTPLRGGVPIVAGGKVLGAIGVSGASSAQEDNELAVAGALAAQAHCSAGHASVLHLGRQAVSAAFQKGAPLFENGRFKVHASRRDAPGEAEVHFGESDVFYVLEGRASFVTGGELVGARESAAGELRGSGIEGGEQRTLEQGDVIVVPAGTPHWFRSVEGPFLYYVVKAS